jgi:hypothetical protein
MNLIRVTGTQASVVVGGKAVDSAVASELKELMFASSGSDLYATDEDFLVLRFAREIWVVPEDTPGCVALMLAWEDQLQRTPCSLAHCSDLPVPWRKRLWFLPLPVPQLGVHAPDSLPQWRSKQSVPYSSRPKPGHA